MSSRIITKELQNPYFKQMWNKEKLWELMKEDDIEYKENDIVIFSEYSEKNGMSGNEILTRVIHIFRDRKGIRYGYCILTLKIIERVQGNNSIGEW